MKTTKMLEFCPKCQAPLPLDAPRGLCAKCLLAAAATETEAGAPPNRHSPPPPLDVVIAAFPQLEIVELIGHGGMGVVYKARQPKLDRFVALKILPQSLAADAAFAERFNREARVLARLNHPSIVTVFDFGHSGGFFYLLMEFVDGVNLRQAMRAGHFSPHQALHLVPKICDALQFAHGEGVLHRDIKPENILLDSRGRVKIADFGIAKLVGEPKGKVTLTGSGMVVGTPNYMAPEQIEHPQDVDQRADIFSLGVVFYEMLTGELPIGRFAPPSQKSAVDPRIDEVVLHALEKEREKRYQDAGEVKTSVEAITAHPGAAVQPAPTEVLPVRRGACYFSTPERMRNCFPGPHAHVFQCHGELRLELESLTFISPWQTRVVIPLKEIRELSIGRFQISALAWTVKKEKVHFLAISYGPGESLRTVHLTPVPSAKGSPTLINAQVAEWFDAVNKAVVAATGASPHGLAPAAVTIHAHNCYVRRVWRLLVLAPISAWVLSMVQFKSSFGPAPLAPWLGIFLFTLLLWLKLGWFAFGFMKAERALQAGDLDAVTGDEAPGESSAGARGDVPVTGDAAAKQRKVPVWWTVSAWILLGLGVMALTDTLTGLYVRPIRQNFYPGIAQLFTGIAMLTLNRWWRRIALGVIALAIAATVFIGVMLAVSPEHGTVGFPALDVSVPASEVPRLAATAVVFLAVGIGWPCWLLLSAKGRGFFKCGKPK